MNRPSDMETTETVINPASGDVPQHASWEFSAPRKSVEGGWEPYDAAFRQVVEERKKKLLDAGWHLGKWDEQRTYSSVRDRHIITVRVMVSGAD